LKPSRQIQHNKSQLILTLNLQHNRASGLVPICFHLNS
jgi:hypothetical protein